MKQKYTQLGLVVIGLLLSKPISSNAQNLLLNGSFENPAISANATLLATPTSWLGANVPVIVNGSYGVPGYPGPQDGQQYMALGNFGGGGAWIAQTFTVPSSGNYVLAWEEGTTEDVGATSPYTVDLTGPGGSVVNQGFVINGGTAGWTPRAISLSLVAGNHTLTFSSQQAPSGLSLLLDNVSMSASCAIDFTGFLPPIGGADATGGSFSSPLRAFKLKSTIPVKFTAACNGTPLLTGTHQLQVIKYSNATTPGTPIDATPQDAATAGDEFRLAGNEWHFNLDVQGTGMSVGIWLLRATLSDGSQHTAWIQIK